jgi:hypothetical protein
MENGKGILIFALIGLLALLAVSVFGSAATAVTMSLATLEVAQAADKMATVALVDKGMDAVSLLLVGAVVVLGLVVVWQRVQMQRALMMAERKKVTVIAPREERRELAQPQAAMLPAGGDVDPLNALIKLQVLQMMQQMNRQRDDVERM